MKCTHGLENSVLLACLVRIAHRIDHSPTFFSAENALIAAGRGNAVAGFIVHSVEQELV